MDKGVGLRVTTSGPEIVAVDELSLSRLRVSEQGIYGIGGGMACSCWRTAALLEGTWTEVLRLYKWQWRSCCQSVKSRTLSI
jgi:hypothetical protein